MGFEEELKFSLSYLMEPPRDLSERENSWWINSCYELINFCLSDMRENLIELEEILILYPRQKLDQKDVLTRAR